MDLSYADDDGFENYVAKTTSPGPWLFVCTALYSACCMIMIPILVTFKRKRKARSSSLKQSVGDDDESVLQVPSVEENVELELREEYTIDAFGGQKERRANGGGYSLVSWGEGSSIVDTEEQSGCDEYSIGRLDNSKAHFQTILHERVKTCNVAAGNGSLDGPINYSNREIYSETSHPPSCFANVFGFTLEDAFFSIKDIVKPDTETRKILKLALPYTMSEVSAVFFWALTTLLISRYTDVNQLSAYVVTALLIGTSETIIKGLIETLETVCPHAIGVENNKLAGQYVQIVLILYSICSVPIFGMWWFVMEGALEWFELSESAINIGVEYSKLLIFNYYLDGIFKAFVAIPDVTDREKETKIYQVCHDALEFALIWILLARFEWFDLFWVGVVQLCSTFVGFSAFVIATVKLGWFDPYWEGLTKNLALRKKSAVMYVIKMAAPLSIGSLFEYGEWELLTIFAASMGQAEVAAWGLMESIWDLLEAFIEGFSNAGSVRLALHLGKGNIVQAKRSAWKSLFLVTTLGLFISIVYAIIGDHIAVLFTSDETLQNMLKAMIPIICFGNVFQSFGSMAWCLVGSQGRYHHATLISTTVTITVSIPLAAFFSLGMHFSLESLIAALVIGYSTISMCLSYLLVTSDWAYISKKVIEENEDSDSSDDPSSSSNASSASDDEPCDNAVGDFPELVLEPHDTIGKIFASSSSASNDDSGALSVSRDSEQVPYSLNMQRENMKSSSLRPALSSSSSSSTLSRRNVDCRAQTIEDDEIIRSLEVDAIFPPNKEFSATPSSSNSDCKDSGATRIIPAISEVTDKKKDLGGLSSPIIPSSNSDLSSNLFSVGVVMEDEAGKAEVSNSSAPFVHNSKEAEGTADSNSSSRSLVEGNGDDRINLIDQMLVQNWA